MKGENISEIVIYGAGEVGKSARKAAEINQIKVFNTSIVDFSIIEKCCIDELSNEEDEINESDIDNIEENINILNNKINMLSEQKNEDLNTINQIQERILNTEKEINTLEKNRSYLININ